MTTCAALALVACVTVEETQRRRLAPLPAPYILPIAKTNAGLAAVLGRETGHAVARHSGERLSQQLLIEGALLSANAIIGDSERRPLLMAALGLGAKFGVVLPFSRA